MNKSMTVKMNSSSLICFLFAMTLFVAMPKIVIADQVKKYGGDAPIVYESAIAQVLSTNENGGGVLRAITGNCEKCYSDIPFNSEVKLYTPLGRYIGLEKLVDWSDHEVTLIVLNPTGMLYSVRVL